MGSEEEKRLEVSKKKSSETKRKRKQRETPQRKTFRNGRSEEKGNPRNQKGRAYRKVGKKEGIETS